MPGDLFLPARHGDRIAYRNLGTEAHVAFDLDGNIHGGMGADWGDYDNDGKLDLFVATFRNESKSLYHNDGDALFTDRTRLTGIAEITTPCVAFGCKFLDYDNDGWLDIAIANGHVQDNIERIDPAATYRQASQLLHNTGGATPAFVDVSALAGPDLQRPIVGRGLAIGDYDNDGRVDLLIVDSEGKPLLLHNECRTANHWLGVRLIGTRCNRMGLGALLTATADGRTLLRQCQTDGSYLSASDARVHFGLGQAAAVESLSVRWPGGHIDTYPNLPVDRYLTLREGDLTPH
jgi:hypothetical protein